MKVALRIEAEPLVFGEGEDAFTLVVRPPTSVERMALLQAFVTGDLAAVQREVELLIENWRDVRNERGELIPFEQVEGNGKRRNLPLFLASLPMVTQTQVMVGVGAFAGATDRMLEGVRELVERIDIRPTKKPATPPAGDGSTPPYDSATSPPSPDCPTTS